MERLCYLHLVLVAFDGVRDLHFVQCFAQVVDSSPYRIARQRFFVSVIVILYVIIYST